jgi:hypothetical protein
MIDGSFSRLCLRRAELSRDAVRRRALQIQARNAAKLERQTHGANADPFADGPRMAALEIQRRVDARSPLKAGNAPQIGELVGRAAGTSSHLTLPWSKGDSNSWSHPERQRSEGATRHWRSTAKLR